MFFVANQKPPGPPLLTPAASGDSRASEHPAGLMAVIVAADSSGSSAEDHTVSAVSRRSAVLLNACGPGRRFVLV